MKKLFIVLGVALLVIAGACLLLNNSGNNSGDNTTIKSIWLKYQPMQCEDTPWMKWYSEGNIQFVKEPTEENILLPFLSAQYGIEPIEYKRVLAPSGTAVCEACNVCPQPAHIELQVKASDAPKLIAVGWKKL